MIMRLNRVFRNDTYYSVALYSIAFVFFCFLAYEHVLFYIVD